jgi:hypothetical protein
MCSVALDNFSLCLNPAFTDLMLSKHQLSMHDCRGQIGAAESMRYSTPTPGPADQARLEF